jgi:two-component system response regulator AdeR
MTETPSKSASVLVVEDEPGLADLYATWLTDTYTVETAYDGEQALDRLDAAPDVVLLDRRMPDLSGDDVLREIRERELDCQVAMVSAVEPEFDIIEMDLEAYLTKPVSQRELEGVTTRLLQWTTYDAQLQEYFALASKKAILDAKKSMTELAASAEYGALERRLADFEEELSEVLDTMATDEIAALLYDPRGVQQ